MIMNMSVTESNLAPRSEKCFFNDSAEKEQTMRWWCRNATNINKPIFDLINWDQFVKIQKKISRNFKIWPFFNMAVTESDLEPQRSKHIHLGQETHRNFVFYFN